MARPLSEEGAERFLDLADGMQFNIEMAVSKPLHVVFRNNHMREAKLLSLGYALLDTTYGTNLS